MVHELKILPQYFKEVLNGNKTFEIRRNDRGFKVGDTLILREFSHDRVIYTGREITKEVTYILEGGQHGLEEGYCILGLKETLNSIGNCARCGRTIVNNEECECKVEYFEKGIELKNIDLTGWDGLKQFKKIEEELQEFKEATAHHIICNIEETKAHAIEEYFDLVQSALGLLSIANISAQEVMEQYPKHLEKLKNRPRKED